MFRNRKIIIGIILFFIFFYTIMLVDTNSVIDDFVCYISGEPLPEELKGKGFEKQYNVDDSVIDADVEVRRIFVLHNFSSGVMYVNYTYDQQGSGRGAHNVDSKWYIEKINGKWIVVDVDEKL